MTVTRKSKNKSKQIDVYGGEGTIKSPSRQYNQSEAQCELASQTSSIPLSPNELRRRRVFPESHINAIMLDLRTVLQFLTCIAAGQDQGQASLTTYTIVRIGRLVYGHKIS